MSVVCVAWSSHVGALMSAASRPGMPSVRVLSSRMLEEPDGVERCLETMRSATALFVFRTTDALWDQLDEGIRLIGKTVPVVCVSYDPAAWALSSVPVETAQTAYRYLTYGGAENLGNLFRFLDALPRRFRNRFPFLGKGFGIPMRRSAPLPQCGAIWSGMRGMRVNAA